MKNKNETGSKADERKEKRTLAADLETNLQTIRDELGDEPDIIVRRLAALRSTPIALVYIDGLADSKTVGLMVMGLVMEFPEDRTASGSSSGEERSFAKQLGRTLSVGAVNELDTIDEMLLALFQGSTVLLADGIPLAVAASTAAGVQRSVEEPGTQTVVRGPKEGFTERLRTNTTLIRHKIKSAGLRIEYHKIGKQTQTDIAVIYMRGIARDEVVEEITRRLKAIETDSILESGYIEEFIQDKAFTPFPLIQNTERPDAVAAAVLEGRVSIVVDGTPFALIAPATFVSFFQSSEDYYQRYDIATFLRLIRFVSFFVSLLMPSIYIAITTFHQEMLPTPLLISLAAQREGVPFPALIEAMLMEITFEVLREAGVRMPRVIGPAISIVGALVLGQAAVQAGLVSAAMVIVVSFTAIASFVIPAVNLGTAARLIRFAMMILAGTFGVFGIMAGLMILLAHMSGLRTFGVPYLSPISPLIVGNLKDVILRVPWWAMKSRPKKFAAEDSLERQGGRPKPAEPKPEESKPEEPEPEKPNPTEPKPEEPEPEGSS